MEFHLVFISWTISISKASRLGATLTISGPSLTSSESPTEWAVSTLMSMVRWPFCARRSAVATDTEVLPTPPLPL